MSLIRFSLDNPLLANLGLLIILVLGVLCWNSLPREIFPNVDLDMAMVNTEFQGASPLETEQQITLPIEEEISDFEDIDHVFSVSREGMSSVYVKFTPDANVDDFIREAQVVLDAMDGLPDTAELPQLSRIRARFPVITLTLFGDVSNEQLYRRAKDVQDELQKIPGVASVSRTGVRDWEIWVQVDPAVMSALKVPMRELEQALRDNLQDLPGGVIKAPEGDILLRGEGVRPEIQQIEDIVVRSGADGSQMRVKEFSEVTLRFEEPENYARFDGKPAINLTVTKSADASIIEIAERVRTISEELQKTLPPGIYAGHHTDLSSHVNIRINTVKSSGLIGLLFVLIALYALLNFRIALVTAFGIPISFLFAVILLYYLDYTLNMVSLFAFLIVLGMIVDDAIIITENIYRHIENGMEARKAASLGAREVFWPVVVSTLTTIAAFLPMFAIGGILGAFIVVIPVVVCFSLLGSLLEAFVVLPAHSAMFFKKIKPQRRWVDWTKSLGRYETMLRKLLRSRYLVAGAGVCALALSFVYANTRLPFQLFGDVETGEFFLNVETANTYSLDDSLLLAQRLEKRLFEEMSKDERNTVLTNVGVSVIDFNRNKRGSNVIQFIVDLRKPEPDGFIETWITPLVSLGFENFGPRQRSTDEIIEGIRLALADEPAIQRMTLLKPNAGPAGDDIEIGIIGEDLELLRRKAEELKNFLSRMEGVNDVVHDQEAGKLEYKYSLNEYGRRIGMSQADLANAVRNGYVGNEVVHVTRGQDRVPVRVIYSEPYRRQSDRMQSLPIVLADGDKVYLGDVADIRIGSGVNQIRRRSQERMAKVTANVDGDFITPSEVLKLVDAEFANPADGSYELLYLGEKKEAEDAFKGMKNALFISLALIFFMLTALFRSLRDPFVVMFAIPFGLIGVVVGHALFGHKLQFLSAVGALALSGIIVNDSLILVDFIRQLRRQGKDRLDAVAQACKVRARPILLTTVTTFLGVSPLIFFSTGQTAFMSPMAVSLGFGLLFATVLILLVLPCFYLIADDLLPQNTAFPTSGTDENEPLPQNT